MAPYSFLRHQPHVNNSSANRTSHTTSRKCQYTAQRSTLRRSRSTSTSRRHTLSLVQLQATRPPRRCSPCRAVSRSEEHTSELQSLMRISYAVFCLKKQNDI